MDEKATDEHTAEMTCDTHMPDGARRILARLPHAVTSARLIRAMHQRHRENAGSDTHDTRTAERDTADDATRARASHDVVHEVLYTLLQPPRRYAQRVRSYDMHISHMSYDTMRKWLRASTI